MHAEGHQQRTGGERPWFTATWLLATTVVTFAPGWSEWSEWTRPAGAASPLEAARSTTPAALVRLFGCHLAHFGAAHWCWNALALAVTGVLAERAGRRSLAAATLLAAIAIPVALVLGDPSLAVYRGASGIASAWFALVLVQQWQRCEGAATRGGLAAVAMLYAAKLASEAATGSAWFLDPGDAGPALVPLAHLVGSACGGLAGIASFRSAPGDRIEPRGLTPLIRRADR